MPPEVTLSAPTHRLFPALAMVLGTVAVSAAAPFIILSGVGPFALPAWRLLGVAALLLPICAVRLVSDLRSMRPLDRLKLVVSGLMYGGHFVLFTAAFDHTSKESAVMLLGVQPLLGAFIGRLWLREPITRAMVISSIVALAGLGLFMGYDYKVDPTHLVGDAMVLGCGLLIVLSYTFGRGLRPKMNLVSYLESLYLVGGLFCLVAAAATGDKLWNYGEQGWFFVGLAILVPTLVGHSMFHYAVKYVPVFYINLAILGEPLLALAIMFALAGRYPELASSQLTPLQGIGGALLLAGVGYGMSASRQPRPQEKKS